MDELEQIKNKRSKEHHYGDVKKACQRAKVSPSVFQSAMKKTKLADLTNKEMSVVAAFLEIQKEQVAEREALMESLKINLSHPAVMI